MVLLLLNVSAPNLVFLSFMLLLMLMRRHWEEQR